MLDRKHDLKKLQQSQKFQSMEAKKVRDFQVEQYNAELVSEYGEANLVKLESGRYAINNADLDVSDTLTSKVTTDTNITAKLIDVGLSTDGSAKDKELRLNSFNWGESAGFNYAGVSLDPSIGAYFADVSPAVLSETDINDMDKFIAAVGIDDPRVIQAFINSGLVQERNFKTDPRNGLLSIYDYELNEDGEYTVTKDTSLLDGLEVAWRGFKKGVKSNASYQTTEMYKQTLNEEVKLDMLSAQQITGSTASNQAVQDYQQLGVVVGTHIGAGTNDEGTQVMKARGTGDLVKFSDIREDIDDNNSLSEVDKGKLITFYEQLKDTDAQGSNLTMLVQTLRADSSLLSALNVYDPSLARTLSSAVMAKDQIDLVSTTSMSYYGDFYKTEDMNQLQDMDVFLNNSGIRSGFLNLRELEVTTDMNNKTQKNRLDKAITDLTNLVLMQENKLLEQGQKFDKASNQMIWVDGNLESIYNSLQKWYEVEESSARLLKSRGQKRLLNNQ